jgi:hypothetical protein
LGVDAVDPSWIEHTDYFPDFATCLIDQFAWATVAARLGNKANRTDFINRLWYADKKTDDAEEENPAASGFLNLSRTSERQPVDWGQAVSRFKKTLAQERCLCDERVRVHRTYLDLFNLLQELRALEMKLKDLTAERKPAIQPLHEARMNERKFTGEVDEAKNHRLEPCCFPLGILEIPFSRAATQDSRALSRVFSLPRHLGRIDKGPGTVFSVGGSGMGWNQSQSIPQCAPTPRGFYCC